DRARISKRLILDGAGQHGGEVLGTDALPAVRQHIAVQGSHQHIDGAGILLAVCPQEGGLVRRRIEPDLYRRLQLAHLGVTSWMATCYYTATTPRYTTLQHRAQVGTAIHLPAKDRGLSGSISVIQHEIDV